MTIYGPQILTAQKMAQCERQAIERGADEDQFMQSAGSGIAKQLRDLQPQAKQITLLVGKGNNGGDAFVAGISLLEMGYPVVAIETFPTQECSPLSQKYRKIFKEKGGSFSTELPSDGVILDGLLGTGFQKEVKEPLYSLIEKANHSKLPIYSIDIPSGLDGNQGKIGGIAIKACHTFYLGQPKLGLFLREGFNYVGKLSAVDFGLNLFEGEEKGYLIDEIEVKKLLPPRKRTQHKYEAGYLVGVGGSPGMGGAPIMSSWAALRAGAGIVRLFHQKGMEGELVAGPLELVKQGISYDDPAPILEECKRAKACFVGPGLGRGEKEMRFVLELLEKISIPTLIDADALFAIAKWGVPKTSAPLILTPHRGEMLSLLHKEHLEDEELLSACQNYSKGMTLVLKGAPTWIFHHGKAPLIMHRGDPGMATAGSGDVLTGVIAALLAEGLDPLSASALGSYLHALSGELAAQDESSYSVMATDLIDYLGDAILAISSIQS